MGSLFIAYSLTFGKIKNTRLFMKDIYQMYCGYNLWANTKLANVFTGLPEKLADQTIESSFPSPKKTMLHIWDAEVIWLKRLGGEAISDFPSKTFSGNTKNVVEGWLETSSKFLEFVEGQDESAFGKEMTVKTIGSGSYAQKAFEMIHHCMNHSTYHRGQLLIMARQLGLKGLPSTDLIFYLRENS